MAFMKAILDNGTPTGQSDANTDDEANHARLSLTTEKDADAEKNEDGGKDDNSKGHQTSDDDEPGYSSFSESEDEHKEKKTKQRHKSDSQSSTHSNEEKQHRVKRKPPAGNRHQPWHNPEPQSHQDMLQEKFHELRNLLTDSGGDKVDKHLLKNTRALMKHYHVSQTGLIPGHGLKGSKSPRSERDYWARSSNAWQDQDSQPECTSVSSPTGDEYILIDGTGDEVRTRRVKFQNVETESVPKGHPSFNALGSLGLPFPIAPSKPRPVSGRAQQSRPSRPRRKAASADRARNHQEGKPKRRSVTRSPSGDSRSRSRSSSSSTRSRSRSKSGSKSRSGSNKRETDIEKAKKTDHFLKDTDNRVLQDWLKRKDKEIKAKKKVERKRLKEKREQKRKEYEEKEKLKEKSEEAVRLWLVKKEEEQRLLQKRERIKRPLQKNEFSYSLELISLVRSPDGDKEDHHTSNPEISSREESGAPFASQTKGKRRAPKLRAKSAKMKSPREKVDDTETKEDRKPYDKWLEEKRKSKKLTKKKSQELEKEVNKESSATDDADEQNEDSKEEDSDENSEKAEDKMPDMDDDELLTDVGQRRDVNMNIKRRDSDSYDPYDKPKDYTLNYEARRSLIQSSDSLERDKNDSPTKVESGQPCFRLPSPPLISHSPLPMRGKPGEEHLNGEVTGDPQTEIHPHPPRPDMPRTSAYRRIKREQASWDEFSENVWTQVNEEEENTHRSLSNEEIGKNDEAELKEPVPGSDKPDSTQEESASDDPDKAGASGGTDEISDEAVQGNYKAESPASDQAILGAEAGKDLQKTQDNKIGSGIPTGKDVETEPTNANKDADTAVADKETPPSAGSEQNVESTDGTRDDINTPSNTHDSQEPQNEDNTAFVREEFDMPSSDALHLNPIKEESEFEAESTNRDSHYFADSLVFDNGNQAMGDEKQEESDKVKEDVEKAGVTFLTTAD